MDFSAIIDTITGLLSGIDVEAIIAKITELISGIMG